MQEASSLPRLPSQEHSHQHANEGDHQLNDQSMTNRQ